MPQSTSPQGKPLVLWKAASGEPNLRMPGLVLAVEFLWNMGHCMSQTWAPPISWFQEVRQSWHETRNRRRSKIQAPPKKPAAKVPVLNLLDLGSSSLIEFDPIHPMPDPRRWRVKTRTASPPRKEAFWIPSSGGCARLERSVELGAHFATSYAPQY